MKNLLKTILWSSVANGMSRGVARGIFSALIVQEDVALLPIFTLAIVGGGFISQVVCRNCLPFFRQNRASAVVLAVIVQLMCVSNLFYLSFTGNGILIYIALSLLVPVGDEPLEYLYNEKIRKFVKGSTAGNTFITNFKVKINGYNISFQVVGAVISYLLIQMYGEVNAVSYIVFIYGVAELFSNGTIYENV